MTTSGRRLRGRRAAAFAVEGSTRATEPSVAETTGTDVEAIEAVAGSRMRTRVTQPSDTGFDAFFVSTWPDVVAYCSGLVADRASGEELAQEAFVRVFPRFSRLDDARPYVFRIAANLCRRHRVFRRRVESAGLTSYAADATTADDVTRLMVDAAVALLRHREREVVLLHYYADMAISDIARVLSRPEGTVKRQLHDAREHLAARLRDTTSGEGSDGSR